jgi:23S rRNA (adenine2030-N6)-methyltransferase
MLSYQHGYHAGNRADVLKHAVLHAVLSQQARQGTPVLYVETHAARGRYDLRGDQALKTGEAKDGVLAFPPPPQAPKALQAWLKQIRTDLPHHYPGSPALAVSLLGLQSRFVFFERHKQEFTALEKALLPDDRVQALQQDGYRGALRLQPRNRESMLLLIDPSYETISDMEHLAAWVPRALRKWPQAKLLIWLPLFADGREEELGAFLGSLDEGFIAGTRWSRTETDPSALEGSAMIGLRIGGAAARQSFAIAAQLDAWWGTP